MMITNELATCLKWAYERSPFYKALYDELGFSVKDFIDFGEIKNLPVIQMNNFKEVSFHDVLTVPMSAIAETCTIIYRDSRIIKARSAQEFAVSAELTKKYLSGIGINRTSIVALDGLSAVENSELSFALSDIGASALYLTDEMTFAEKAQLVRALGADTIISGHTSLKKYMDDNAAEPIDNLFRVIMISYSYPKNGEREKYETLLGTPVYEIVSFPFTSGLIDLQSTESDKYIVRDSLLLREEKDGIVLTDTAARTIPLIGIKVER